MERKVTFAAGEYYHLYNRGVNKTKTFMDAHDYWRFIFLLYLSNSDEQVRLDNILQNKQGLPLLKIQGSVFNYDRGSTIVDIGAFCLMPNHFHILIKEKSEGGISQFMRKLGTAYSMYFNKRHNRTGPLFSGRFKAEHVARDEYLKYLFAYIHLNPIKLIDSNWKEKGITDRTRAEAYLDTYEYSSYLSYRSPEVQSHKNKVIHTSAFPQYFSKNGDFGKYVHDWLTYRNCKI